MKRLKECDACGEIHRICGDAGIPPGTAVVRVWKLAVQKNNPAGFTEEQVKIIIDISVKKAVEDAATACYEICRKYYQPILCAEIKEKFGLDIPDSANQPADS